MASVTVIITGRELLTGAADDKNGPELCRACNELGLDVSKCIIVGDDAALLAAVMGQAVQDSDCVIITGGLGPTTDDVTRNAISHLAPGKFVIYDPSLDQMKQVYLGRGKQVEKADLQMTLVPEGAEVIPNRRGIAPGFIIYFSGKPLIFLPGPPAEMKAMLDSDVVPWMTEHFNLTAGKRSLVYTTVWLKETEINSRLEKLAAQENLDYGITAGRGTAKITLYYHDLTCDKIRMHGIMKELFGHNLLSYDFHEPQEELVYLLKKLGMTISTAESCTGGLVAKRITDVPGSSCIFNGSAVTYSNDSKLKILGVRGETLREHGAVSEETAREMVTGAGKVFGTDMSLSTTGIAGPDGGTPDKPVGTVCFGFRHGTNVTVEKLFFNGDRAMIRHIAALYAINYMRIYLLNMSDGKSE